MKECPYQGECSIAMALNDEYTIRKIIRQQYCVNGNHEKCVRAKLLAQGEQLPKNLLPDGKVFEFLNKNRSNN